MDERTHVPELGQMETVHRRCGWRERNLMQKEIKIQGRGQGDRLCVGVQFAGKERLESQAGVRLKGLECQAKENPSG